MKFLDQIAIILVISCIGEFLAWSLPFPIPGALYGLLIMFTGLCTKIIPLHKVEGAAHFLIDIMTLMFTPLAVQLITMWDVLQHIWFRVFVIVFISTFVVMFVTGHVAQFILRHEPHLSKYLPKGWYAHIPHPHLPHFSRHSNKQADANDDKGSESI